jgi:hypothetical protein
VVDGNSPRLPLEALERRIAPVLGLGLAAGCALWLCVVGVRIAEHLERAAAIRASGLAAGCLAGPCREAGRAGQGPLASEGAGVPSREGAASGRAAQGLGPLPPGEPPLQGEALDRRYRIGAIYSEGLRDGSCRRVYDDVIVCVPVPSSEGEGEGAPAAVPDRR